MVCTVYNTSFLYTIMPPTIVIITFTPLILSGDMDKMSFESTAISATLPLLSEPFWCSINSAYAEPIV